MAFVKLDTKILNSTIWMDADACKLFITALLMAEPFEVLDWLPTVKIGSTDWDDFKVPAGWYGYVPAAGPGIVRQALMEWEPTGMEALQRLASPEPASRTASFEGRRMVRIDGGFLILNYIAYRDRDHSNAERQARFRARKKIVTLRQQHNAVTITPVTHADADAYADAKSKSKAKQKKEPVRGSRLPQGWKPDPSLHTWAVSERPDLDHARELDSFRDYWQAIPGAKGVKLDWPATYRNWIRRANGGIRRAAADSAPSKARQKLNHLQDFKNGLAENGNSERVPAANLPMLGSSADRRSD